MQQDKARAKKELEMRNQAYENMSYEDNEMKQGPESASTTAPKDDSGASKTHQEGAITHFWTPAAKLLSSSDE